MSEFIELTINGQKVQAPEGSTILAAARQIGVEIPTLCYQEHLGHRTSCFLCVVHIVGRHDLQPACAALVQAGMEVETDNEEVIAARKTALELLFSDHAGECVESCGMACFAHVDIPEFIGHLVHNQAREAVAVLKRRIPFPSVLGQICPAYCEKPCVRGQVDEPISIRLLHRYAADADLATGSPWLPPIAKATGQSVAIVGAGAAGLTAAYYLLQKGHAVTLYDARDRMGGILRELPADRLDPQSLDGEIGVIEKMGAQFKGGWRLDVDQSLASLFKEHQAVLLAFGASIQAGSDERAVDLEFVDHQGLDTDRRGIAVDRLTQATNRDGVFAAGEAVTGKTTMVRTVANARVAAAAIDQFLNDQPVVGEGPRPFYFRRKATDEEFERQYTPDRSRRKRVTPLGGKLDSDHAPVEAGRCLQCGCEAKNDCQLRAYGRDYEINPYRFEGERRVIEPEVSHNEVIFEPGKCILCGLCIDVAKDNDEDFGLSFTGRGFSTRIVGPLGIPISECLRRSAKVCAETCPTAAIHLKK